MNSFSSSETVEHRLVQRIKSWTGSRYIGDDCAILPSGLLVSMDTLVEGTHFRLETTSMADLGWKAIAVNLSDIAAMAGRPRHLLISVGFPKTMSESVIEALYSGITECANAYRARIVGGDLVRSRDLTISVTVLGDAHEHGVLTRGGAKDGDIVVVTGDFGASAAGLIQLEESSPAQNGYCVRRHRRPIPRLCESWALNRASSGNGALMDASDGLADALFQIARASNVSIRVDLKKVPVHDETMETAQKAGRDPLDLMLYGGEDFELVACISEASWKNLNGFDHNPFKAIGTVESGQGLSFSYGDQSGPQLDLDKCFQHTSAPK
jgi:thiamine-monophosphate kinase